MQAVISKVGSHLFLVELPVPMPGFESFVASWVLAEPVCVVVDPGPAVTVEALAQVLAELGIGQPDFILLTHIHIDHAGGVGQFAARFDRPPVVCHRAALKHLTDPSRLWQGSVMVLGDIARAYGAMEPVDPGRLVAADGFDHDAIIVMDTPGHSPHHCSFLIDGILFAGETGGVCLALEDGSDYLRPATPPRFFFDTQIASLDKLIAAEAGTVCYGHFGARDKQSGMLEKHRRQLHLWRRSLACLLDGQTETESGFEERCLGVLLETDPLLEGFSSLSEDVKLREKTFLKNSIRGFIGCLQSSC